MPGLPAIHCNNAGPWRETPKGGAPSPCRSPIEKVDSYPAGQIVSDNSVMLKSPVIADEYV